jgi:hypothetical protein
MMLVASVCVLCWGFCLDFKLASSGYLTADAEENVSSIVQTNGAKHTNK